MLYIDDHTKCSIIRQVIRTRVTTRTIHNSMKLAWVPWVLRNPWILGKYEIERTDLEGKGIHSCKMKLYRVKSIKGKTFGTHGLKFLTMPLHKFFIAWLPMCSSSKCQHGLFHSCTVKVWLIPMKPNQTFISNCIKEWHGLQFVGKLWYLIGQVADTKWSSISLLKVVSFYKRII